MVYVIQVCWQLASRISTSLSCSQAVSKPLWHIPLLCVQWKTPYDGQRNCQKHVEFYFENKFEELVHLVDCIIRIFQDARSPARHVRCLWWVCERDVKQVKENEIILAAVNTTIFICISLWQHVPANSPNSDHLWKTQNKMVQSSANNIFVIWGVAENFLYICLLGLLTSVTDVSWPCVVS